MFPAQTQLSPRMRQKITRLPVRYQHVSRFVCHDRSCNRVSFKRFLDCELRRDAAALSSLITQHGKPTSVNVNQTG